ncbi:MAG: hypothetical protein H8D23_39925 [Candidatus Brocadiales bacterium]|nr:hypothetical protein [Candidatus Brocadiales bacterium]
MDITIKDVPEGCEDAVKKMALVAIDRFLQQPLQPEATKMQTYKDNLDAVLVANSMPKKFDVAEELETEKA